MGKYWNEEIECMAHEDMKKLQSERLVKQVKHVWDNVPYYKKLMEEKGVTPDDIHGIEDQLYGDQHGDQVAPGDEPVHAGEKRAAWQPVCGLCGRKR